MNNLEQAIQKAQMYNRRQYSLIDPQGQFLINVPSSNKPNKTSFFNEVKKLAGSELLSPGQYIIQGQNSPQDNGKIQVPFQFGEAHQMVNPHAVAEGGFSQEQQAQILELSKQNVKLDLEKQTLENQLEVYKEKYAEALETIAELEEELNRQGPISDEPDLPAWLKPLMPALTTIGTNFLTGLMDKGQNQAPQDQAPGQPSPDNDQDEPNQDFEFNFNEQWAPNLLKPILKS